MNVRNLSNALANLKTETKVRLSFGSERVAQNVVKSHIETNQYTSEELKRMAWTLYSPEETRSYQTKVNFRQIIADKFAADLNECRVIFEGFFVAAASPTVNLQKLVKL